MQLRARILFLLSLLLVVLIAAAGLTLRFVAYRNDASCAAPSSDAKIVEELEAELNKLVAADEFSGAVLVARNGAPLFLNAYGEADKKRKVANSSDTKFNLASMNKMFTAVAITQLAQEGRLKFSDTLGQHLPDYPNKVVANSVTIHQLLTHTSGLGDYLTSRSFGMLRGELKSVTAHFPLFVKEPLLFEPGTRFHYSNAGYIALGAIIERATGQTYFDYVREHIFRPAGMNDTDSFDLDQNILNLAVGYTEPNWSGAQSRGENTSMLPFKGSPAGGGYSTVEDLLRFDRALRGYKLLSKEYIDLIFNANLVPGVRYGYGFREQYVCGHRLAGHTGGYIGISAVFLMYLDQDYTVVVLSNYGDRAAQVVARRARELIGGRQDKTWPIIFVSGP